MKIKRNKFIYILSLFFSISLFLFPLVSGASNEELILQKAYECIDAIARSDSSKMGNISNPFKESKNKSYLICKSNKNVSPLYQVLLDLLFSEIDKDIEKYIDSLSSKKPDTALTKDISDKLSPYSSAKNSFSERYYKVCMTETLKYAAKFKDKFKDKNIQITTDHKIKDYFGSDTNKCSNLVSIKLAAYNNVANLKVQRNAINGNLKDKKEFMTKIKDNYDSLMVQFDRYIAKFGIIKNQWTTRTKN